MPSFFVSGANRGLGLALVERLSQDESRVVFAGARNPASATALNELAAKSSGRVHVLQLDPTQQESVTAAAQYVEEKHGSLDVLLSNAGTMLGGFNTTASINYDAMRDNYDVNVIGVARLTDALLPLLRKGDTKHVFILSSIVGSAGFLKTGALGGGIAAAYGPSKAAATMLAVNYHLDLRNEGFCVKAVHPGWVKTDMGGEGAQISIEESIDGLMKVINETNAEEEIALYNYDNTILPF